jgi:lysophospholipase L1-like esterase
MLLDNIKIPKWSRVSTPFYFKDRQSSRLLITVGDSWTWGDSLGNTKARMAKDDSDYRLNNVYGGLMSAKLESNWVNLALPGISNTLMITWLEQLLSSNLEYTKIDCIITLTETGRHEDHTQRNNIELSLENLLDHMLAETYQRIDLLKKTYPTVNFIVAHNFTDPIENHSIEQTWLEVLLGKTIKNNTRIVISEHIGQLNYNFVYVDTSMIIDKALERITLMDNCDYCYKEDSRHPNEKGHQLWAEYLLNHVE